MSHQARLLTILKSAHLSEKTASRDRQYVFEVMPKANKLDIKNAVEQMFNVKVQHVRTSWVKSKPARFGQTLGRHSAWKKAYVTLMAGEHIELTGMSA